MRLVVLGLLQVLGLLGVVDKVAGGGGEGVGTLGVEVG